jgi:lambda family phage tail tape measure protein
MQSLMRTIENSFASAFTSIVDGTKSASDAFREMARQIIAELFRILVVQQLVGQFRSIVGGGGTGKIIPSANGNMFQGGNVVPFANGGVVSRPTLFPMMGGRTGLMGEAGPEAIMPLKRGRDGKLGVAAEGGAPTVNQTFTFNLAANGDDSVKRIIAQTAPQIVEAAKNGVLDARRRGGAFRATFR